ncbi:MAG: L-seryl-tRNA(Sec) selenium transferase [Alphaproteobacteria bacterium]|nr:L-seryl-tRNA(Sec) selenium transferase [Alphaproteobacteria bacterium]
MRDRLYRQLPSVDRLLRADALADVPRAVVVEAARQVLAALREAIAAGDVQALPDVTLAVAERAAALRTQRLRGVINATGVVLHTNLGRAPFCPEAARAVADVAAGYSNTELRLADGRRGGRLDGVRGPLRILTGCQDAIAVNNNAAAVMLVLTALAQGREVVVSRGELVEIGGSFRVPDVMALSGARLVEVGTTNRTRAADFERAVGPETALIMRVHPSNFRITGFTERPTTVQLAGLGVPLVEDLGSGALFPGFGEEPVIADVLADGAALVCFSGDKLLGGPQAGVIAGDAALVRACRRHPLYRALRLDKLGLAALEATLRVALEGDPDRLPALRMMHQDVGPQALALADALRAQGLSVAVEDDVGYSGGGALPGEGLPTKVVAIRGCDPDALARRLRLGDPPVVARVARDAVLLDPRTVLPGQTEALIRAVLLARRALTGDVDHSEPQDRSEP